MDETISISNKILAEASCGHRQARRLTEVTIASAATTRTMHK